jgi:hypothetical protein
MTTAPKAPSPGRLISSYGSALLTAMRLLLRPAGLAAAAGTTQAAIASGRRKDGRLAALGRGRLREAGERRPKSAGGDARNARELSTRVSEASRVFIVGVRPTAS